MKKSKKIVLSIVSIIGILALIAGCVAAGFGIKTSVLMNKYKFESHDQNISGDKIHFINVVASDAILLESDGKFALVDCAEDTDNPRGFEDLELKGQEQIVIDYVKKIAARDGKVTLEFVIGTHSHSDHIGGFDSLILDKDITVKTAYLKKYNENIISEMEKNEWDNLEVYNQMLNACKERDVNLVQDLPLEAFKLSNFDITIFNGEQDTTSTNLGENENSLGILVEKNGIRAFLAGDMNNIDGDEDRIAPLLGHVNLLKVGHHGHKLSTSKNWIKTLSPDIAIVTNYARALNLKSRINLINNNASIYGVLNNKGIVALFSDDGIKLYNNI